MKKLYFSWLLPVFMLVAAIVAGSCSQEEIVEPDLMSADKQTRAVPSISISCSPAPKGETETYLGLKQTYRFGCVGNVFFPTDPDGTTAVLILNCELSIHSSTGGSTGFEILTDVVETGPVLDDHPVFVKFTAPGYYHVTATTQYNGATYQETTTYCVVSRAMSMTLPESVELGVPFDLSFNFADSSYPDPTIRIAETSFGIPACTILSNDGQGNYRLRIDQPGCYTIYTGLGDGMYSAWSNIEVYFRPENVDNNSVGWIVDFNTRERIYENNLLLCDANNNTYTSLPYRVYFTYELVEVGGVTTGPVSIVLGSAASGVVSLPTTEVKVEAVDCDWDKTLLPSWYSYYYRLSIPKDRVGWGRIIDPPIDPPGGGIGPDEPLDPPGGGIVDL